MNALDLAFLTQPDGSEPLPGLSALIADELAPKVVEIDQRGVYPERFLRELGALGGFASLVPPEYGGDARGMAHAIDIMDQVSQVCASSGFLVWAQFACIWYVLHGDNDWLRASLLPELASGRALGGTAQSNSMKSCAGIEATRLKATRVEGGYVINGTLPWVSNIGPEHYFHFGAQVAGECGLVIGLVRGNHAHLQLSQNAHFIGMEGTNTFACQFREVFLPDAQVLCHPPGFDAFRARTKAGFVLMQTGMALGLVDACVAMMKRSNQTLAHVNCFLDDQAADIEPALRDLRAATRARADRIDRDGCAANAHAALELRLAGGELALRAAHAAMLHLGAKGYLSNNAAQRRLREAYFIAIVTPAIKHLRKELHDMRELSAACQA
jgi:alkylation response protein AidB-like acyl-CoA dehydrogenase